MPFRSQDTLQAWLDEFLALGYEVSLKVIPQDGEDGANTGLVAVTLHNASTSTFIQPESHDSDRWVVTMEAEESAVTLDAGELHGLASDLSIASSLCAFLQAKSQSENNDSV
ncbi:hypothetical protein ACFXP7_13150 [Microbacterium sp. P06]|uniref:hypothetical protein n=1 Tax=unclassified Microbacterium TaxID=2609290 RepID=UPI0037476318